MTGRDPKLAILEKALSEEIGLFLSMSDAEIEAHIPNSRIKQRIKKIGEYEVHVFPRDHDPPHFHVISTDGLNARFRIDDGSLISGDLRSGVLKRIDAWYNDIKTQLLLKKIWDKRNN